MAPKAKPKAGGRAKAMAVVRRPAARGVLRRPGLREDRPEPPGVEKPWEEGLEVPLREVDLRELGTGTQLVLTEALYYGNKVQVAGKVVRLEVENGSVHLHLKPMGTKSEELLKACSGDPHLQLVVHCCPEGCGAVETGDKYIHGLKAMKWTPGRMEEDWMTNLLAVSGPEKGEVDELAALRKRGDALDLETPGIQEDKKAVASSSSGGKKKRKKKKEKKRKKEKRDKEAEKKRNFSGRHPVAASLKDPVVMFEGTGLDSKEKVRKKVAKRARRYLNKKKKDKSTSSSRSSRSQSSSSTEGESEGEGVFTEGNKARGIAERCPGLLCFESLKAMQNNLLRARGDETESGVVRPVATMYYRQELQRRSSGPMQREMLTLATALDALLKGRPAQVGDILGQRLKACEACLNGVHWTVAQRMEVASSETTGIAQRPEIAHAQRENYVEHRTHLLAAGGGPRKGDPKGKSEKGGKGDKGKGGKGHQDQDVWKKRDAKDNVKGGDKK